MNSNGFGCACFVVLVIAAFAPNNSVKMLSFQNVSVARVVDEKSASTFDCHNGNDYRFVVIENPKRRKDGDPVIPKDLNIVVGEEVISKIELPKESEVKDFSLNSTKKNKAGFEILERTWRLKATDRDAISPGNTADANASRCNGN